MSLLEDIFLHDEADEAQELERVIEGDEYDERPRSRSGSPNSDENEPKDDEAEEDKRRVDPSSTKAKRVTKNPRFILNPARLTGPRGIQIIPDHFKDFKFKGKGHEKEDVDMVLKKLEHWAYRLYPKFQFEDCLKKIEALGKKRPVMVHLQKIRTDQFISEETVVQNDSSDEETQPPQEEDEFDKLLQQQIDLARATPAPGSVKKVMGSPKKDRSPFTMPKATSSPSISDEQKERMIRNRKLAEERRLARLKQNSMDTSDKKGITNISEIIEVDEEAVESNVTAKTHNRSYIIDSSDDECNVTSVNEAVTVDVHNGTNRGEESNDYGQAVQETGGNNLDDIEMYQNVDKNDAVEVDQDVVEIIDDVGKVIGNNVTVIEPIDKIVEINDQADKVVDNIIEINDQNQQVVDIIEINYESHKGVDEVIEVNDLADKVVDDVIEINDHVPNTNDIATESTISHENEIIKENDNTVDVNNSNKALLPEAEISNVDDNKSIDSLGNNDTIQKENIVQIVTEEILSKQDNTVQKDSESNKSIKDVSNLEKDAKRLEEVIEDNYIMDVDFNDEF